MARVPYLSAEDLDPDDRALLARPIALFRALANSPRALARVDAVGSWIRFESSLDPRLRQLAILQVGYSLRSDYEWSHHLEIGRQFGVTTDDIAALIAESSGGRSNLGELERLVLEATRQLTTELEIDDATWSGLSGLLSVEHLVDLVIVVSFYNCMARVLGGLEIDVEPEYQSALRDHPLPAGD